MSKEITLTPPVSFAWRDYLEMTKPKVVALMLLTVVVGMCLSVEGALPVQALVLGLTGIALMSASAATFNHVIDRKTDAVMGRTRGRPLPNHRISAVKATIFAFAIGILGFVILFEWVNTLTAWLTFFSLIGYAVIYTMYLKRATSQNIVIGGLAGAMPPLLGWTAVTNHLDNNAFLLVMIIFLWTPPHFWALSIAKKEEYAKADIPVLPVTHGDAFTKTYILLYTVLLGLACLMPVAVGMSGDIYLIGASILSALFFYQAWLLKYSPTKERAMKVFTFSIYHLMLLFVLLLVDHYI
ncbi:protoheme IX farnesyltransferase [Shewanella sp. 202IG2-18]|uniref:heme o synthase n=1 Tax=Parashewanella hymeniacidonis TaxID=2807618 RepID=UPI001961D5C4|nr:protoheme IX farnesyltransferase [Parashewanella hymeniacidonis]